MPRRVPARIHVLLAARSAAAVVLRRGPSRHTALIGWDRSTDTFTLGQWLYGRIYERRCDLSPDGRHLIYFAMNGRWSSRSRGSWTAVSRAPYLKALAFFPKGDCWQGGGLFLSADEYWLNGCGYEPQFDASRLTASTKYPWHETYGAECPGVYYIRLQRDGWAMKHASRDASSGDDITVFEKRIEGHWLLRKIAHASLPRVQGRGCYFDEHALCNARSGQTIDRSDWEWAEVDGGRLLWARDGKLYRGRMGRSGLEGETLLQDFDPLRFERIEAPY